MKVQDTNRQTDADLLKEFSGSGSQAAFATLVERHGPMVHAVAMRTLSHHHDAEDVTQAAFLVLAREAEALSRKPSVAGWLHTVARRLALDAHRSRESRQRREATAMNEPVNLTRDAISFGFRQELDSALDGLPERYRHPLVIFHLEGATLEEVARRLDLQPSTLRTRLSRAREMLRNILVRRGVEVASVAALSSFLTVETKAAAFTPGLLSSVVSTATGNAGGVSIHILQLAAKATTGTKAISVTSLAILMKTKATLVTTILAAIAAVGTTSYLVNHENVATQSEAQGTDVSLSPKERARLSNRREIRPSGDERNSSTEWVNTSRDWKKILLFLNNDADGSSYYEVESRLEKLALEMSAEELTAAFTDMADMAISTRVRNRVEWFMLRELEQKNPAFAFGQYIAKYQAEGELPQGIGRFNEWMARDPVAATAWYDSQLTAGTFDKSLDGKTPVLLPFEGALISSLLATDPASAEERLNAVPPDQRGQMISQYFKNVAEKDQMAFADMLRRTMPLEQCMGLIKSKVMPFNYLNDPAAIRKNLDRIAATPDERAALLAIEARNIMDLAAARPKDPTRDTFDEFRQWAQAVDPASADLSTGAGFAKYLERRSKENPNIAEEQNFVEKLAIDYHDSGAGDAILIPLIEASGSGNISFPKDKARVLANKISDPILREELLQQLN